MNRARSVALQILVIVLIISVVMPILAQEMTSEINPIVTVQNLVWSGSEDVVEGAEVVLTRMEHGLSITLNTSGLEAGHVYTAWWIIINTPENCSDGICGYDDNYSMEDGQFILDENGMRQPNVVGREFTQLSELRATAAIANEDGTAMFRAHLPIGDVSDYLLYGEGLSNPMGAEIHFVIRSHGLAQEKIINKQLFMAWDDCPEYVENELANSLQYAIFMRPAS